MILAQVVRIGGAGSRFFVSIRVTVPFLLIDDRWENCLLKQNSHFVGEWATQKRNGGMNNYFSQNTPLATLRKHQGHPKDLHRGYTEEKPGTTTWQLPT